MSVLNINDTRVRFICRDGAIYHNGEEVAARLEADQLEYSTSAPRGLVVEAAFLAGARWARRRAAGAPLPVGTILPLNPVSMKAFCIGVNERALENDLI